MNYANMQLGKRLLVLHTWVSATYQKLIVHFRQLLMNICTNFGKKEVSFLTFHTSLNLTAEMLNGFEQKINK